MKKILFVINTLGRGGAERAMINLFEKLDPEKYDISLFVLTGQGELSHELPQHVHLINDDYIDVSVLTPEGRKVLTKSVLKAGIGKGLFLRRFLYLFKNFWKMMKNGTILVEKLCWRILSDGAPIFNQEFDLAVAYLEGGSTYYVANHVKAKKKVAFVHIDYSQAGYTRELDSNCYQHFQWIFTVSDEVKDHFLEVYPEYQQKVSVFHNLLNQKRIIEKSKEGMGFEDDFEGYRILTIGRLTYQKRYDIAIESMALLKQKCNKPVRWYVLGEGHLRSSLQQQIKDAHLENDFLLLGSKDNPFPYYKNCDFYVHATGFEGKSIAIQEAQTLGKPILATDCSGNREQIENGVDGLLCPLTPEDICQHILYMIDHPEKCLQFAKNAKQKVLFHTKGLDQFLSLID